MNAQSLRPLIRIVFVVSAMVGATLSNSHAIPLAPGQTVTSPGSVVGSQPGFPNEFVNIEANGVFTSNTSSGPATGSARETVATDVTTGRITFYYEIQTAGDSPNPISTFSVGSFKGFSAYVDTIVGFGGTPRAFTASRSVDGDLITVSYTEPLQFDPFGFVSFYVATDAQFFRRGGVFPGYVSIDGNGILTPSETQVSEPGVLAIMLVGFTILNSRARGKYFRPRLYRSGGRKKAVT